MLQSVLKTAWVVRGNWQTVENFSFPCSKYILLRMSQPATPGGRQTSITLLIAGFLLKDDLHKGAKTRSKLFFISDSCLLNFVSNTWFSCATLSACFRVAGRESNRYQTERSNIFWAQQEKRRDHDGKQGTEWNLLVWWYVKILSLYSVRLLILSNARAIITCLNSCHRVPSVHQRDWPCGHCCFVIWRVVFGGGGLFKLLKRVSLVLQGFIRNQNTKTQDLSRVMLLGLVETFHSF